MISWFAAYGVVPVFIYGFSSDQFQQLLTKIDCARISCRKNQPSENSNTALNTSATTTPAYTARNNMDSEFQ